MNLRISFNKFTNKIIILSIIVSGFLIFSGFFKLYQSGNIKNDGSGSLNIVYSGTIKQVEDNGYSLGNFPFGEKNIRDCFSSDNVSIKKLQIAKPGDTAYMVIMDLDFKNVNDLNKLKGFADMNAKITKADNGTEFKWTINSNDRTKLLNVLNFSLTFESEIVSTNGISKDGTIQWYKTDFSKENDLLVVLKSDLPVSDNKVSGNQETGKKDEGNKEAVKKDEGNKDAGKKNEENKESKKEKICGLWGVELPLIMLGGFVFYYSKRRKRS